MPQLTATLKAWGTPAFEEVLKQALADMDLAHLPLQQGLSHSSYTDGAKRSVLIMHAVAEATTLRIKAGIFYSGLIAGCSCADDPTPQNEITEYCEVQLSIDKATAETTVTLLTD